MKASLSQGRWRRLWTIGVILCVALMSCSESEKASDSSDDEGEESTAVDVDGCQDIAGTASGTTGEAPSERLWLYQLQDASISEINASQFDILTIDYSRDGSDETAYTPADLQSLHSLGKVALAYLSIGEAEDYRYYFDSGWVTMDSGTKLNQPNSSAPCWLRLTNPDWVGNYKVQYWSEQWQTRIIGYLDKVIDAGFDGVYMDIVDAYEYWGDDENGESHSIPESVAAARMISFVKRIAYHARIVRGQSDFHIIPQNAEGIVAYDSDGSYLQTVSGIGIEDLYYDETSRVPDDESTLRIGFLDAFVAAGKTVFVIDYVDNGSGYTGSNRTRIDDFRSRALARGYVPYVGLKDRELNKINTIPGIQQ